ncbi:MAG TPA: hypothetical protein H9902_07035 [Candidatus Stackebrandtia faecavium]|nr:hypothetical protein [Candidatus Stackebrandtia faecavium]
MSLSTQDVSALADTLATGKQPKVVFTQEAGQIAGKVGKVVRLEEPAVDDFVVVRFGNDELPFTAAEVRVPQRGELSPKPKKQVAAASPDTPPPGPPLLEEKSGTTSTTKTKKASTVTDTADTATKNPAPGKDDAAPAPKKKPARAKPAAELSVTLAYKAGEWTVAATKGAKVIAKPVPVKASAAVDMVQSLDSPAVAAVVEDIVEQQRKQVAEEAARLREQLAAAEARLAELD